MDLADILNQRELRPGKSWEDVFQSIEQFVSSRLDYKIEYHVALETLLSVSFTVGRILNPKSGIKVIPVQKTLDGCIDWKRNDTNEFKESFLSQLWWLMTVIAALRRPRQEDC